MKKKFTKMIAGLGLMLITASSLAGCGGKAENKVVVFTSQEDYRNTEMEKQLKDKFPDLDIKVEYYSTGNNAAKIKAEGTKTEADILIGVETASMIEIADNFADLSSVDKSQYIDSVNDEDNRYLAWEKFVGGVYVNTKVLADKGLKEPTSYDDLLKEEYKGLIAMPNPKTSSTGYMYLNSWVNEWGEDKAFKYVDELQKNIKEFTESGSGPMKKLAQGEIAIGLGMVFQGTQQINDGIPLKLLSFKEGNPYNTTSISIIKGRETNENVMKVFNFLETEFMKYDKEEFSPGAVLKNQQIKLENYPTNLKDADMSTIGDSALKEKLLSKWKY